MRNRLHIVSFDVPWPADYGGAIDVFYKIKALHAEGCAIILHCYEYGRAHAPELEQYCEAVYYYTRATGLSGISAVLPYIVYSRRNAALLKRLAEIDAPVLFEGVHTAYFLGHPSLKNRFKAIRVHNVEHHYYAQLSAKEPSTLRRLYYMAEAILLRRLEHKLHAADAFFPLSAEDTCYFQKLYPCAVNVFIPPFHQHGQVTSKEGNGQYCLYQGNLAHPENREAALFLLREVFPYTQLPAVIAGRNPGQDIIKACGAIPGCRLIVNPDAATMDALLADAHIHVLPTFQQSGVKLKLLTALFGGRHVVTNKAMRYGTGMPDDICPVANSAADFITIVNHLVAVPFTQAHIAQRKALLAPYENAVNAKLLKKEIVGR
ncbi:MAG: glycosyltransferase [Taibaiella sp.]|nr:glycosyltransferase [Taibaiella sp.]